jgi:hypothetical protein
VTAMMIQALRNADGQLHVELAVDPAAVHAPTSCLDFLSRASVGFGSDGRLAAVNLFEVPGALARIAPALDRDTPTFCPHEHAWIDWWLDDGWAWFPVTLERKVTTLAGLGSASVAIHDDRVVALRLDVPRSRETAR